MESVTKSSQFCDDQNTQQSDRPGPSSSNTYCKFFRNIHLFFKKMLLADPIASRTRTGTKKKVGFVDPVVQVKIEPMEEEVVI